ncbi:MAG: cupredoxin domain-containing protein [Gammaproteobacteria bacterium]
MRSRPALVIGAALLGTGVIAILLNANAGSVTGSTQTIHITAQRFSYSPARVVLKKGVPVILELSSADRLHGFDIPALGVRTDVVPGQTMRLRIVPNKVGRFAFHCDNYCGSGHEGMTGMVVVRN